MKGAGWGPLSYWVAVAPSAGPIAGMSSSWTRHIGPRRALAWMWEALKGPQEQRKGQGVAGIPRVQRGPVLLWGSTVPSTQLKKQTSYIFTRPEVLTPKSLLYPYPGGGGENLLAN